MKPGVLPGLQYLRFFAAALVVLHHVWQDVSKAGTPELGDLFPGGASGVDIFFVISGFIMVHVTNAREQSAGDFFLHRLARVAPPYWVATALMIACITILPHAFTSAKPSLIHELTSFLFVPWPHPVLPGAMPVLQLGWTLNYEMLFYGIFALALAANYRARIWIAGAAIGVLCLAGLIARPTDPWGQFYTFPIMLEFVFGMAVAAALPHLPGDRRIASAFVLVGAVALVLAWQLPISRLEPLRFAAWGLPAAAIVCGVAMLDRAGATGENRLGLLLGDASYSIYLTHLFTLGAFSKAWGFLGLGGPLMLPIALSTVACVVVGVAFYWMVERRLTRWTKRLITAPHRRTSPSQANPLLTR